MMLGAKTDGAGSGLAQTGAGPCWIEKDGSPREPSFHIRHHVRLKEMSFVSTKP